MTISSSLNAGVAGLAANAGRLATISDNIANASTYGYKKAEADFHSMVVGGNGGQYSAGGVRFTTERRIGESGSLVTTANSTDLAVRGRGFLPVTQQSSIVNGNEEMLLSSTGSFRTDSEGYLTTGSGLVLLGWPALPDGTFPTYARDTADALEPVQINVNQLSGEPTTQVSLGVNLPASETASDADGSTQELSIEYFDNLGTSQNLDIEFAPTIPASGSSNQWTMTIRDGASSGASVGEYVLTFDDSRASGGTLASVTATSGGAYDSATGKLTVNVAGGPIEFDIGALGSASGMTQLSDGFAPLAISKDGYEIGNVTSVEVDENGIVQALYDTGITRAIYKVPLVDLPNPDGLIAMDSQTYAPSPDSGSFFLWDAGDGPTGDIISYALEESNVDVAGELTDLIQTQRAYSSNAKIIQTVDEMLQETTNIKR
ncbi:MULTISPECIES: flagellar hook protein FlgE [Donghicola]|mgnify:CR=1 FL=1|jgi:flagellar hook protein FlgE|uniref:flagellar hook protein FlgE n=1 Tax=Rhodobacterales TaxID=204455 RepID=UPI0025EE58E6|nr:MULTISPECIES: flagellar hook protein FlgE [Donghicola]MCI5041599.1 flagellar hook protein FlgE [Donghicola eburneus]MCT4578575.1 flagellar hook protein FlgE [Donghicola sp.]